MKYFLLATFVFLFYIGLTQGSEAEHDNRISTQTEVVAQTSHDHDATTQSESVTEVNQEHTEDATKKPKKIIKNIEYYLLAGFIGVIVILYFFLRKKK